ncbi:MAG: Hsp70 family protein [Deltaproteobacteria bacterium]|nr:Hsp70 family protein [Deltaproteobacteria bacterium]
MTDAKRGADDAPIIGIDLGMTSVIAAFVPGPGAPPKVIPGERGSSSLPAVVGFKQGKGPVVGKAAQDMLTTAPADTVTGVKRLLGRKSTSQAVRDLQARVGFRIVPDGEGVSIEVGGARLTPAEVAGLLLNQVRTFAEAHLGKPVKECVVAVPAYFNAQQKEAVKDAARRAKLEVVKIVHEPTAVALAYGYNKSGDSRILILDMGGIRLDVSVMEITGNVFDVVATGGDAYLGGANLDARITEWILAQIKKKFGKDLSKEAPLLMKVRTAAEQAKRELSRFKAVDLQIPLEVGQKGKKPQIGALRLPKDTVEKLAEDLVARVINLVNHVLEERGLTASDIDDIIFVGGGTRLPLLKSKVHEMFGKEPKATLPPEEVIALGAALLADSLRRGDTASSDMLKEPIGIALADGRFMRIIDKDSKLPITRRVMIPTTRDKQRVVEVDLFQGESDDLLNTEYLGTVVYEDIPEAKAGEAKIVVDLVLGMNRILVVTSPEDGREGEKFEIKTKEHESIRGGAPIEPALCVAKNEPTRPAEAAKR